MKIKDVWLDSGILDDVDDKAEVSPHTPLYQEIHQG